MDLKALIETDPFSLRQSEKEQFLLAQLNELCEHHRRNCPEYAKVLNVLYPGFAEAKSLAEVPFLPVGLFKQRDLLSVKRSDVFKVLTSSGTTGQAVSKIYLDQDTARLQTQALSSIMKRQLGVSRCPMIIIDTKEVLSNRSNLTARATAILGLMNYGRDHFFALNPDMTLDTEGLKEYLTKYSGQRMFLYGFTFMIWQYFLQALQSGAMSDTTKHLSKSVLIHSGGWKRLIEEQVTKLEFNERLRRFAGIPEVYNFYGMVEQVGSIFIEGEDGFLYAPSFADVIIRNPLTWKECQVGEKGVIQVLSALPKSYPGFSILTEDLGVVEGIDDSTCNRFGKRFSVIGRVAKAVLRGCSDVHAYAKQEVGGT